MADDDSLVPARSDEQRPSVQLPRDGFEVIAWIDPPLLVSQRAGGTSYDVMIAERPMALDLPRKGPDSLRDPSEQGSWREIPEFPGPLVAEPIVRGAWISVRSGVQMPEKPLIVEAVRLRWQDPARRRRVRKSPDAALGFDRELGAWLSVALDWLAAWRGATRRYVSTEQTPQIRMGMSGYDGAIGGGQTSSFGLHFPARRVSKPSELRAAFIAASRQQELPLEHQLFAEALAYGEAARWRHAIISACTAAEVALSESVERLLVAAGRDEKERKTILERPPAIMDLCRLHSATKPGLPVSMDTVRKTLATPRNKAAHRGKEPDEDTVRQALITTRALLAVTPLPTPAAFIRAARQNSPGTSPQITSRTVRATCGASLPQPPVDGPLAPAAPAAPQAAAPGLPPGSRSSRFPR